MQTRDPVHLFIIFRLAAILLMLIIIIVIIILVLMRATLRFLQPTCFIPGGIATYGPNISSTENQASKECLECLEFTNKILQGNFRLLLALMLWVWNVVWKSFTSGNRD